MTAPKSSDSDSIGAAYHESIQDDELTLLDLLIAVAKHKVMIFVVTLGAALLAVIVSLLLPNIYTGTARIMPPQQTQSAAAMLLGQLGGVAGVASSALGIKNPSDLYVGMLKSRTVADRLIGQFNLQTLYEKDTMVETRLALDDNTTIRAEKDGLIRISFDDKDPQRAAAVANGYVEELDRLTQSLAVGEAAQRRLFFERQLQQAKQQLADAEVALKETQEKTGLIQLDNQAKALIEAVATVRAQMASKEVELASMRAFATERNPEYIRTQRELDGLRVQLSKLERQQISGQGDVLVPTGKVPEVGLEYVRKLRDVKYSEAIFELLSRQYELAKVDEARDAAIVQVVDHAVPPDRKSKPIRSLIVLLTAIATGIATVAAALVAEWRERARRDPRTSERLQLFRRYFLGKPAPPS
jgi:uncharacterized protein involved in exopolysaccharide biosynthesis